MGSKWNRWVTPISDKIDGKKVVRKEYNQWAGMFNRAKGQKYYEDVKLSEMFKSYDLWCEWAREQKGFLNTEYNGKIWSIDKDILGDGRVYSEDVCVFVPAIINYLFIKSKNKSNVGRIGVRRVERISVPDKYEARLGTYCNHIGTFDTVDEAYRAYLSVRLEYSNDLYAKYGDSVDDRVWEALFESCEYSDIPDILNF